MVPKTAQVQKPNEKATRLKRISLDYHAMLMFGVDLKRHLPGEESALPVIPEHRCHSYHPRKGTEQKEQEEEKKASER